MDRDGAAAGVSAAAAAGDAPASPSIMTDDLVAAAAAVASPPTVAEGGTPVAGSSLSAEELDILTADIIAALKTVYDPEIPSDIYELGLIYKIDVSDNREVSIDMTLTAPGCPVAGEMPIWFQ